MADDALNQRDYFLRARDFLSDQTRWSQDGGFGVDGDGNRLLPDEIHFRDDGKIPPEYRLTLSGILYALCANWAPLGIANSTAHDYAEHTLNHLVMLDARVPNWVGDYKEFSNHPSTTHADMMALLDLAVEHVQHAYDLPPARSST